VPDFLSPELQAFRDRIEQLATGTLIGLRDDAALEPATRAAKVRDASRAAGVYGLTQADDTPALTLLVVRETLARHGVHHLPGLFGADAGVLAGVAEPLRSSHLATAAGRRQAQRLCLHRTVRRTPPQLGRVSTATTWSSPARRAM
jgi:hypothetical protein